MLPRLVAAFAFAIAVSGFKTVAAQEERGRPVILMLHGRGMSDRDTAGTRHLWFDGLASGSKQLTGSALLTDKDVRLVWYADVLDPRSSESCDYAPDDPRARRDAKVDPNLKGVVSFLGGLLGTFTNFVSDSESATTFRALASDASFLSDSHKRCASERRLSDALDRAKREGRPVILVAHSLGSVVAYDYLSTRADTGVVQRLVSVGSILGATELRRLLIGGDSTDVFDLPRSVKTWINIRNDGDALATTMGFGKDILATPPADEPDQHEMLSYLKGSVGAGAILSGWCAAFQSKPPAGCGDVTKSAP